MTESTIRTDRAGFELRGYRFRSSAGHLFTVTARGLGRALRVAGPGATFVGVGGAW